MPSRTHDQNTLKLGSWNVTCDVCGFKMKSGDVQKRWDGLYVCKDDFEPRHPSDFQKGFKDDPSVPFTRPDSDADSSYTDVGGNTVTTDNETDTIGDADATITYGTSNDVTQWTTTLTASRTATVRDGSAISGARLTIYKLATGDTLDVVSAGENVVPLAARTDLENAHWLATAGATVDSATQMTITGGNARGVYNVPLIDAGDRSSTHAFAVDLSVSTGTGICRLAIGTGDWSDDLSLTTTAVRNYFDATPDDGYYGIINDTAGTADDTIIATNMNMSKSTSIRTIPAGIEAKLVLRYDGTSWSEFSYTTMGI